MPACRMSSWLAVGDLDLERVSHDSQDWKQWFTEPKHFLQAYMLDTQFPSGDLGFDMCQGRGYPVTNLQ